MNKEKEVMEAIIDWWYKPTKVSTRKMFEQLAKSIDKIYQAEIDKLKAENESRIIEIMNDINPFSFRTWGEYYKEVAKRIIGGK